MSFSNSSDQFSGRKEVRSSRLLGRLLNNFELFETQVRRKLSGRSAREGLLRGRSHESRGLLLRDRSGDIAFRVRGTSVELVEVLLRERIVANGGRLLSSVKDR